MISKGGGAKREKEEEEEWEGRGGKGGAQWVEPKEVTRKQDYDSLRFSYFSQCSRAIFKF